jgi:multidrug efflux system membrane fusion protein
VTVDVATATRQMVPLRVEALGNVTTMASVAIKARVDSEIVGVHFADGARVKQGDLLFTLDSRTIEAEMKRLQAVLTSARAQLEQTERDVERYTELVAKNAATQVTLQNARTQVNIWRGTSESSAASIEALKVQLSFTRITAPISGRIGTAGVKVGNLVRQADAAPLATINQIAPIYVTFAVPQRTLPDVRHAIAAETASVEAVIPGEQKRAQGVVSVIENTVDPSTGMVTVRATMPNTDELLWPGTLVNARLTLRNEQAVVIPSVAVQVSQAGTFVFVVKGGAATVRPVKVARGVELQSIISEGLEDGEIVVTDGHLLLSNGTRVTPRVQAAGS